MTISQACDVTKWVRSKQYNIFYIANEFFVPKNLSVPIIRSLTQFALTKVTCVNYSIIPYFCFGISTTSVKMRGTFMELLKTRIFFAKTLSYRLIQPLRGVFPKFEKKGHPLPPLIIVRLHLSLKCSLLNKY